MNSIIENLVELVDLYAQATNLAKSTISRKASGSGDVLTQLPARTITVKRAERAAQWFSDNWPAQEKWPRHIKRPKRNVDAAKAPAKPRRARCA